MANSAIQSTPRPSPLPPPEVPAQPGARKWSPWMLFRGLASLRLTVILFVLSFILVFFGTMAQMNAGIGKVVDDYFRSLVVWIPFQLMVQFGQVFLGLPASLKVPGSFPFPAGLLLGMVLLVNLLAAHLTRFRVSWKRSGILMIHAGLILLGVGEIVTGFTQVEGDMSIAERQASNFLVDIHQAELAIVDTSKPGTDETVVVPAHLLRQGGTIRHDDLPVDIEVEQYMTNSEVKESTSGGGGRDYVARPLPEVSGTDPEQKADAPSAYLILKKKGTDEQLTRLLVSTHLAPLGVNVGGSVCDVSLRYRHTYKPYTMYLLDFKHEVYPGTDVPKDFSSRVRLIDPSRNEDREVLIYMNSPLRYQGETFYQSSFMAGDRGTILHVVRNPVWTIPYWACTIVSLGMLVHFGLHLSEFLRRRRAQPAGATIQ